MHHPQRPRPVSAHAGTTITVSAPKTLYLKGPLVVFEHVKYGKYSILAETTTYCRKGSPSR